MSKMGNIAIELDEKAVELGFADHLEAMANGYDWGVGEDGVAFLFKVEDEQEKAHEAWLAEKQAVILELREAVDYMEDYIMMPTTIPTRYIKAIRHAIDFVEGCHD